VCFRIVKPPCKIMLRYFLPRGSNEAPDFVSKPLCNVASPTLTHYARLADLVVPALSGWSGTRRVGASRRVPRKSLATPPGPTSRPAHMVSPPGSYLYRIRRNTQVAITSVFSERLVARITLTPRVRKEGGRRRTAHTCQAREAIATAKKSGCNRSSQRRHPALSNETRPSPNRTCGNIHQLGVSRAATIDNSPALLGSLFTSPFSQSALYQPAGKPRRQNARRYL
jgi:hypothetical protein